VFYTNVQTLKRVQGDASRYNITLREPQGFAAYSSVLPRNFLQQAPLILHQPTTACYLRSLRLHQGPTFIDVGASMQRALPHLLAKAPPPVKHLHSKTTSITNHHTNQIIIILHVVAITEDDEPCLYLENYSSVLWS
jgi:hypothetical protein